MVQEAAFSPPMYVYSHLMTCKVKATRIPVMRKHRNLVISAVVSYWLLPLLKYMTRLEEELLEPITTMKLRSSADRKSEKKANDG